MCGRHRQRVRIVLNALRDFASKRGLSALYTQTRALPSLTITTAAAKPCALIRRHRNPVCSVGLASSRTTRRRCDPSQPMEPTNAPMWSDAPIRTNASPPPCPCTPTRLSSEQASGHQRCREPDSASAAMRSDSGTKPRLPQPLTPATAAAPGTDRCDTPRARTRTVGRGRPRWCAPSPAPAWSRRWPASRTRARSAAAH